jgi:hypothetical protein
VYTITTTTTTTTSTTTDEDAAEPCLKIKKKKIPQGRQRRANAFCLMCCYVHARKEGRSGLRAWLYFIVRWLMGVVQCYLGYHWEGCSRRREELVRGMFWTVVIDDEKEVRGR